VFTALLTKKYHFRELYDATFSWLEHKDLRTPSREFRTLLQSYHTSDAGMMTRFLI
jgi:hypothetical protein